MLSQRRRGGFTLIEILIVISIIAILAGLATGAILRVRKRAIEAIAKSQLDTVANAIKRFYDDEGYYPGSDFDLDENAFPAVYEALLAEPRPKGKGGRSAPYLDKVNEKEILVFDEATQEYREATAEERFDDDVPKYLGDQWMEPMWYRENKSKEKDLSMHNRFTFDLWSKGPNRENETLLEEKGDDIGNW